MTVPLMITDITAATITCTADCPICQHPATVTGVPVAGFVAWRARGVPIWDALPGLTPAERVVLAGGCHSRCSGVALPYPTPEPGKAIICPWHGPQLGIACPVCSAEPESAIDLLHRIQAKHLFTEDEIRVIEVSDEQ